MTHSNSALSMSDSGPVMVGIDTLHKLYMDIFIYFYVICPLTHIFDKFGLALNSYVVYLVLINSNALI